jgi:hypothetical protein
MQNIRRSTEKLGGSHIEKLVAAAAETALKDIKMVAQQLRAAREYQHLSRPKKIQILNSYYAIC